MCLPSLHHSRSHHTIAKAQSELILQSEVSMASYGAMLRPSAMASSAAVERAREGVQSTRKALAKIARPRAFGIPTDPEAAAVRIVHNLVHFRLPYTLLLGLILLVTLVPRRPVSLIILLATSNEAVLYAVLLRVFPDLAILHFIDPRLVVALFLIGTVVQLVLTNALVHLLASLAIGIPIVLIHAAFVREGDDSLVTENAAAAGELVPLADENKEAGDLESGSQ